MMMVLCDTRDEYAPADLAGTALRPRSRAAAGPNSPKRRKPDLACEIDRCVNNFLLVCHFVRNCRNLHEMHRYAPKKRCIACEISLVSHAMHAFQLIRQRLLSETYPYVGALRFKA